MNIVVLKTLGGEELIAEFVERTSDFIIVSRPRVLHLSQQGAGLIPYIMSDPENLAVAISKNAVAVELEASREISDSYLKAVTNIQLAG